MVASKKVKTNLYLNKELKEKAKQKLDEYGLNLSAFTNLMLAKFLKNDIDLILPDETRQVLQDYEIKKNFEEPKTLKEFLSEFK
jgi:antitoxin component of RelBE/YafQ-DinJ toxin-antitoxin module